MKRFYSKSGSLLLVSLALAVASAAAAPAKLQTAEEVLGQIERTDGNSSTAAAPQSDGAKLTADVQRYRDESGSLTADEAARRWFELYDRAAQAAPAEQQMDLAAYDLVTMQAVGVPSVLSALPPPSAWRAWRQEAAQRAARGAPNREALSLRFLGELLAGDHAAALATLDSLDKLFTGLPAEEREIARQQIARARAGVTKAYGNAADIAAVFEVQLRAGGEPYGNWKFQTS